MDEATTIEEQRQFELQQARQIEMEEEALQKAKKKAAKKKKLTFLQKVSKHWLILVVAAFFDLIGFIPFVAVVVNFVFGLILWLYFALQRTKRTKGEIGDELIRIGLPILGGSVVDFFIGILPTCLTAALIRIATSK